MRIERMKRGKVKCDMVMEERMGGESHYILCSFPCEWSVAKGSVR